MLIILKIGVLKEMDEGISDLWFNQIQKNKARNNEQQEGNRTRKNLLISWKRIFSYMNFWL